MTAKEAREKASSITTSQNSKIMEDIRSGIAKAVTNGKFSIYYYNSLPNAISDHLKSEGYTVDEFFDQRDGTTITISW